MVDSTTPVSLAALRRDVEDRLFDRAPGPRAPGGAGLEVELLPLSSEDGRIHPLDSVVGPSTLGLVRAHARGLRWSESLSAAGAPQFRLPTGGTITFEPGGQIEYSSPPRRSLPELLGDVEGVLLPLVRAGAEAGVRFIARGIDPVNPVDAAPLQVQNERYRRMAAHFRRRGGAGDRMMRQTAALHLHLDLDESPFERWRVGQAAAPLLLALFANSSRYEGGETGHRSWRARQWREIDPTRTGLVAPGAEPVDAYLDFALDAPAILLGSGEASSPSFREVQGAPGADAEAWHVHLSTLFPEVRPRGWLEVRSLDALPARWWAVPLVVLSGVLYDREALDEAVRSLPVPDGDLLERAGHGGMGDPAVAESARILFRLGLEGAARLGSFVGPELLRRAEEYRERFVEPGRDPAAEDGDEVLDA